MYYLCSVISHRIIINIDKEPKQSRLDCKESILATYMCRDSAIDARAASVLQRYSLTNYEPEN